MAGLGLGPKHELMVADEPLKLQRVCIYTRKETLFVFILLHFKKKNEKDKTVWQRVNMQGMGRHTASFVGMADRLN